VRFSDAFFVALSAALFLGAADLVACKGAGVCVRQRAEGERNGKSSKLEVLQPASTLMQHGWRQIASSYMQSNSSARPALGKARPRAPRRSGKTGPPLAIQQRVHTISRAAVRMGRMEHDTE